MTKLALSTLFAFSCVFASQLALAQDADDDTAGEGEVQPDAKKDEPVAELKPVDPQDAAEKSAEARKKELAATAYRFCHDPDFGKNGTEGVDFCAILDASSDEACPEARKSCPSWVEGEECEPGEDCTADSAKGKGGTKSKQQKKRVAKKSSEPLITLRLPPFVGYLIIGAAIALVLYWFLKSLKNAGWESNERDLELAGQSITEAERNLLVLPEARARVLIDHSYRALGRGDAKEAAILLHLAVLRHLDDEGLARWHPSKTNGDYLRAIRSNKPIAQLFRGVANQTERIRFGDGTTEEATVAPLLEDAKRLLIRRNEAAASGADAGSTGAAAPGTALLMLIGALAVFGAQACGDGHSDPAFHNRGPMGMAAMLPILREAGLRAEVSRSRLASLPADTGVVVIRSSAASHGFWPAALKLDKTLDKDISVVVIDDLWRSEFFLPVTSTTTHSKEPVSLVLENPAHNSFCTWRFADLERPPVKGAAAVRLPFGRRLIPLATKTASVTTKPLELAPLVTYYNAKTMPDGRRAAFAWAAERREHDTSLAGCLYVFADRDLFTNISLTREANVRFTTQFFAALAADGRRIIFLDRFDPWTGTEPADGDSENEPQTPAKPLEASNMLPFIAQAMVALIALFLAVGAAFGPLRDPAQREHKAFIEHVEAIGRQYARTGIMGLTHSARSLARLAVMRNRDQVRGGSGGGWSGVASHLAHKLELDEKDVRAALRLGIDGVSELGAPAAEDPTPSSEKMLRTLSRMLGGRDEPGTKQKKTRRPKRTS